MPDKCVVPRCDSNSKPGKENYTTVFKFPRTEAMHRIWVKSIPRQNWFPGKRAVVCEKHFEERFISKTEDYVDCDGIKKHFSRARPVLLEGAVPTIFPNLPKYLSKTLPAERRDPEERRGNFLKRYKQKSEQWLQEDIIKSFDHCINEFKQQVTFAKYKVEVFKEKIVFFQADFSSKPLISVCITIYDTLILDVFKNNYYVIPNDLKWILSNSKLDRWSQLQNILDRYAQDKETPLSFSNLFDDAKTSLQRLNTFLKTMDYDDFVISNFEFLCEQINLTFTEKHSKRYSPTTIISAFLIYMQSPAAYCCLRENCLLNLPHVKTLQAISSSFRISVDKPLENEHFLSATTRNLTAREQYIILQVDEIYVKQNVSFKNGRLYGSAENSNSDCPFAKTVLAFLVSSAFGHFKEIVALVPVNKLTGDELSNLTKKVCLLLSKCNLKTLVIISDNNRINRVMFQKLSELEPNKLSCSLNPNLKTFLTFDTVHLLKSIRNNWINQKDFDRSFVFPSFLDHKKLLVAKFSKLRDLYKKECNCLLKMAPKLNYKTVYPSTFDRQKVSLVTNIFHETTISALKINSASDDSGTVEFLEIIHKWWTIVNIKNPVKHILHKNSLERQFENDDDDRLKFLADFLDWLNSWKSLNYGYGFLTHDTYNALTQSVSVMTAFIIYSLKNLEIPYVLPGKLQTDNLEGRFSRYRQLCGGNYNVSVLQIVEAEKKMRIKNLLGLTSARYGKVKFNFDMLPETYTKNKNNDVNVDDSKFLGMLTDNNFLSTVDVDDSSLLYICGYSSFKLKQKLECSFCINLITADINESTDQYFNYLNRGGLTVPSGLVMTIGQHVYCVVQNLISKRYENLFIKVCNQKSLIVQIALRSLTASEVVSDLVTKICSCETTHLNLFTKLLGIMANILLNNYCKLVKNAATQDSKFKKRKLETLS